MICLECGNIMKTSDDVIEYKVRGEVFKIQGIPHSICNSCGEVDIGLESAAALSDQANELYRKKHGLLTPVEIRQIRERLGVTQQQFERIIGAAKTTLSRWESGSIMQPCVADTLLRVIRDHPLIFTNLKQEQEVI